MWIDQLEKIAPVRSSGESRLFVVEPRSEEEFRNVVNLIRSNGLKAHVIGTGENGIGEPVTADVYISTRRYVGISESSDSDLYVKVKSGTVFLDLLKNLERNGMWIPFWHEGTVGGFASINRPFHYSLFHGYPRDWLLGARIVTGLGEVINSGSRTPKFSSGYKIWKAMSGALGKLGIYLEHIIRVIPKPEEIFVAEIASEKVNDAIMKGASGITVFMVEKELWTAWFMGHSRFIRKVSEEYRQAEIPQCEGERITSVINSRGEEAESVRRLKAKCIVSFYGTGYSRVYNGDEVSELRKQGFKVIGEKGCRAECIPQPSQSFLLLKRALDPEGIFL
ncbi:FAD-binding protein [Metallosphaera hakonensis JCM 8857 = DSM 7519]|uniref:FAD-binding oxidoreductase n=3 Tax=Metallosphaera hakonensis TaxID=79601 RepID=A0A2U9ISE5_9CREN|nr:FAD-binding protein [Metallosphaera hakonensis JCM 8857 = DSM 7519]